MPFILSTIFLKKNPGFLLLKPFVLFFLCALCISEATAQVKTVTPSEQIWTGYFNQSRFSKRWGMWVDLQLRTKDDFVQDLSQGIARAGLTYYISNDVKATAGYAFINHFPADGHQYVSQPEHRPWQQLQWHNRYPKTRTMQWIRLEERFRRNILNDSTLGKGNAFNFRVRYNLFFQVPLTNKPVLDKAFSFIANDEIHINFGKKILYNYFDQNRFFVGLAYHVNAHDNIQFGYSNVFQQLTIGNKFRSLHIARIFFFHNLNFQK